MRPSIVNDLHYDNDGDDDHGGEDDDDDEGEDDSDVKITHDIVLKPECGVSTPAPTPTRFWRP